MRKILTCGLFLLFISSVYAQNLSIRQIARIVEVSESSDVDAIEFYQAESVQFDVYVKRYDAPITLPDDAYPVWRAWVDGTPGTLYINATGTVVNASSGHVRVTLTPSQSNMTNQTYKFSVPIFQGANYMGIGADGEMTVNYSPASGSVSYVGTVAPYVSAVVAGENVTVTTNGSSRTVAAAVGAINDLSDVTISSPSNGQTLSYNGSAWVNAAAGAGDMTKAVYDTGDNGQVDTADDSDALGGTAAASYATDAEVSAAYAALAGATFSGDIAMGNNNITGINNFQAVTGTLNGDDILTDVSTLNADNISQGTVADAYLPGLAWSFSSNFWIGPFDTGATDEAGYERKQIQSGAGGYEIAGEGITTSSATQQGRSFKTTVNVGGRTTSTQLATSNALVLEWFAESSTSTTCKLDIQVWGNNGTTEVDVYSATGLTVDTANVRKVVSIARASLTTSTLYSQYIFEITLYTKDDAGAYLVRASVNGEAQ